MTKQSFLQILQYNIRKSLRIQESFLIDKEVREFNIVTIQKQDCNNNNSQSFSSAHNFFHLVKNSSSQSRTCIYINKHLRLNQWIVETAESDICSIRILTRNTDDETQTLKLLNVYNSCLLFTTFTERFSIIQEWLWTIDHKRFQSTSFSLKRAKMLHSSYDDWYSTKHHYKCKTEIIAEIRHYYLWSSQSICND